MYCESSPPSITIACALYAGSCSTSSDTIDERKLHSFPSMIVFVLVVTMIFILIPPILVNISFSYGTTGRNFSP